MREEGQGARKQGGSQGSRSKRAPHHRRTIAPNISSLTAGPEREAARAGTHLHAASTGSEPHSITIL